jgi:hypothetical protein
VTCIRCSREVINILQTRNRVLCSYKHGLYGLIHRTFLEYLRATQPLRSFEKDRNLIIEKSKGPTYSATFHQFGSVTPWAGCLELFPIRLHSLRS